jgi:hypothetical protein
MGSCGQFIYFFRAFLFLYKPLRNLFGKIYDKQLIFPSNFFLFGKRGQFSLFFSFSILFHLQNWGGYNFSLLSFLVSKFFLFWNRCTVSFPFSQLPFLFKWVNFFSLPPLTSFSFGMNEQFILFFFLHHPFFCNAHELLSFFSFNLFHFRMCTQMVFLFFNLSLLKSMNKCFFPSNNIFLWNGEQLFSFLPTFLSARMGGMLVSLFFSSLQVFALSQWGLIIFLFFGLKIK